MTATTDMRHRPQEMLKHMSPEVYRHAYDNGMSLSAWLEREMPSGEYKDGLDAFERMLSAGGIRSKSLPEVGVYASKWEDLHASDQLRALVPEWICRQWRRAQFGKSVTTRGVYISSDETLNTVLNPYSDAAELRATTQLAPAIPLSEVIALTTPIDNDAYRAVYLTDSVDDLRQKRVAEGTEIPLAKLTTGENTIRLSKFGRALEATYEQLRRQRLDKIAFHVARMAIQSEKDKVVAALDVLVSGDGNTGTEAEVLNLTTLDTAASAGTLTLKGWLAFKLKFADPYMLTTALVQEAVALQLFLLNVGSANVPLVTIQAAAGLGGFTNINPGLSDGVRLGWTSDAPALKIVGFDRRMAIERVTEIGSNISEIERYVTRQTQVVTFTETDGYAVLDKDAAKVLNVNA